MQNSLVDGPLFVLQSRQFAGQRQYAPIVSGTFTGSWVRTLGSRWTNEAKFGVNRVHLILNQTDPNVGRDQLDANRSYPCTTITGVDVQLGCLQDIDRTNLGLEFIDNVAWFAGSHSVKFGFNFRRRSVDPFQAGYPNVTYNSLADFAANRIFQVTAETDGGPALTYGWQYDGYVQDDWRVTSRMTLSMGVRYELATEFKEENDLSRGFDLTTLELTAPGAQIYAAGRQRLRPAPRHHLRPARQRPHGRRRRLRDLLPALPAPELLRRHDLRQHQRVDHAQPVDDAWPELSAAAAHGRRDAAAEPHGDRPGQEDQLQPPVHGQPPAAAR